MRRLAAVSLLALVLAPLAAAAPKTPVFGLRAAGNPKLGYFVYSLPGGGTKQGGVIISNSGTAAGTVKLFVADATTGRTTGAVYLTDRKPTKAGSWISLSSSSLFLKPGQHKVVHFTVTVPAGAKPGQWVGGIVAETSRQVTGQKSKRKANVQIRIRDLTIVAVQVNVPGPPHIAFKIGAVKTGGQRGFQELVTHIENNGNVMVKPTGTVTVSDSKGVKLQTLTFRMDTFLPQTAIDYPLLLKKALPPGDYTAAVSLVAPGASGATGQTVTAQPGFSVSKADVKQVFTSAAPQAPPPGSSGSSSKQPLGLIGAAAGGLVVLLLLLWLFLRRRKSASGHPETVVQRSASAAAAEPFSPVAEPEPAPLAERTAPPPPPPLPPTPAAATPQPAAPTQALQAPPAASQPACDHFWEVAYDRGTLEADGVWRFPHRCSNCGLELLARDVADASSQATARR